MCRTAPTAKNCFVENIKSPKIEISCSKGSKTLVFYSLEFFLNFIFKIYFLIGGKLLYNIVMGSAMWQCKSTVIIHISYIYIIYITSLLSLPPHPLPHLSRSQSACNFSPAISVIHGSVYMSMLLSPFVPLFPSLTVSVSLFSIFAFPFLPCK